MEPTKERQTHGELWDKEQFHDEELLLKLSPCTIIKRGDAFLLKATRYFDQSLDACEKGKQFIEKDSELSADKRKKYIEIIDTIEAPIRFGRNASNFVENLVYHLYHRFCGG